MLRIVFECNTYVTNVLNLSFLYIITLYQILFLKKFIPVDTLKKRKQLFYITILIINVTINLFKKVKSLRKDRSQINNEMTMLTLDEITV